MRPQKYTYTVTDTQTGEIVIKDCSNHELHNAIGIPIEKISAYILDHILWKRRYLIDRKEISRSKPAPKPVYMDKQFNTVDKAFQKRLNNILRHLKQDYPPERLRMIVFVEKAERVS